jgi:hypothetical protein
MKQLGFIIITLSLTLNSFCQEIFNNTRFEKIIEIDNGFISIIKMAEDEEMKKFLVKRFTGYYNEGIAFHDKERKIIWVRALDDRIIFDIKIKNNNIFILNAKWQNSKVNSSAVLYETKLNLKGRLLHVKKVSRIKSEVPNSRIHGFYDKEGSIWEQINWERNNNILINGIKVNGCKKGNIRIRKISKDSTCTFWLKGKFLRVIVHDICNDKIGFICSGDDISIRNKSFGKGEIIYLQIRTSGKLEMVKPIANKGVRIEHLELLEYGLIISGSFQKRDNWQKELKPCFCKKPLVYQKSNSNNIISSNGFIAYLNDTLSIDWLEYLESNFVVLNSMSLWQDTIVLSVKYKNIIEVNNRQFISLKDTIQYIYNNSDAILLFFKMNGNLIAHEQIIGNGSEEIEAYLMDEKIVLLGDFLYSMKVYNNELNSTSKNSCNYLIFKDKDIIN